MMVGKFDTSSDLDCQLLARSGTPFGTLGIWLLFIGLHTWCVALCVRWPLLLGARSRLCMSGVLHVRCPWSLGARSLVCTLCVLCSVCGVLGHVALGHRCARLVCCVRAVRGLLALFQQCARWVCFVCDVSGQWRLFTCVRALCVALCVRSPWPLGACAPVCTLGEFCCVCGVLGRFPLVHRYACLVCCFVCAVSLASLRLFTDVHARCVVRAVSLAIWRLFTGVQIWSFACPGPLPSYLWCCSLSGMCVCCALRGLVLFLRVSYRPLCILWCAQE